MMAESGRPGGASYNGEPSDADVSYVGGTGVPEFKTCAVVPENMSLEINKELVEEEWAFGAKPSFLGGKIR